VRARTPFVPAEKVEGPFTDPVVLLRAPYRITLSYAGADRAWKGTWSGARELPVAVQFTIRDGVSERTLLASSATVFHTQLSALCANSDDERRCGRNGGPKRKPAAAPGEPGRD
jgi:general secretion pathway protein J